MARILVVDDEKSIRITLAEFLKDDGHDVTTAEDAEGALRLLAEQDFAVVVSDIIMPRITGTALLTAIKEEAPNVQVILITGEPNAETAGEAVRAGAFDYLSKPIGKRQLLKTVSDAARIRALDDERRRLEDENLRYREHLEQLVEQRTAALQESHEGRELALQGADLGTWDWRVDTDQWTIDERWAGMLGYTLAELEPRRSTWSELVHTEDLTRATEAVAAHLLGTTPSIEIEHRMRHKSGAWIWVLNKGRVIERDTGGAPLRACGTHLDITERKRAEAVRAEYRQVQKVQALGRLAGGVAHDLNNLLTPILGYAELIRDDSDRDQGVRDSANEILRAGFAARDLVQRLLAFGRKQALEYKALDLNETVTDFERLVRHTIRDDIEVELDLSVNMPTVMADAVQIEQVLMNLVVNAEYAMPRGGRVLISTSVRHVDGQGLDHPTDLQSGAYVVLTISDSGCGMDDVTREQAFEPFFSTKGDQGTGLGLSTVHGIVKQHGGSISLHSEVGMGTTFGIFLPASGEAVIEEEAGPERIVEVEGSETILLVEDNEQVRQLVHALLRRHGYNVLVAEDGAAALATLASYDGVVDLLFTDLVMPGMGGRELFVAAASERPEMKVLYMSGYGGDVVAGDGVLASHAPTLQKPFGSQTMGEKVREILES